MIATTVRSPIARAGVLFAALGVAIGCGESSKGSPSAAGASGGGTLAGNGGDAFTNGGSSPGGTGGPGGTGAASGNAAAGAGGTAAGKGGGGGRQGGGGADDTVGGQGGDAGGSLQPLIDAFCSTARACCTTAGKQPGPLEACEAEFASQVDTLSAIDRGTVRVDQTALAACVSAYTEARTSCVLTQALAACRGIFVGTVSDGGSCTDVMECERAHGPKVCLKLQTAADPELGVCTSPPRGKSGTPCASSCAMGAECSTTASSPDDTTPIALCFEEDGLYCPIGESCAPIVADGMDCTWNEACGSDGFCLSTCATRASLGTTCQFDYGCQKGLTCDVDKCVAEPVASDDICAGHVPSFD